MMKTMSYEVINKEMLINEILKNCNLDDSYYNQVDSIIVDSIESDYVVDNWDHCMLGMEKVVKVIKEYLAEDEIEKIIFKAIKNIASELIDKNVMLLW